VIQLKCHYVQHVIISGSGEDFPVALIFPNNRLLKNPDYQISPEEGCFCPRNLNELGKCLQGCLHDANCDIKQKFSKIKSAAIIDSELSLEDRTLTPSMKVAPRNILDKYKDHLVNMYGENVPTEEEVYIVKLDVKNKIARANV
jgi:long-subunit acyl-CoA synthetase (AMP-forming)